MELIIVYSIFGTALYFVLGVGAANLITDKKDMPMLMAIVLWPVLLFIVAVVGTIED